MSRDPGSRDKSLDESLARVHDALSRAKEAAPAKDTAPIAPSQGTPAGAIGASVLAVTLLVLAIATGQWWLVLPALGLGIASCILLIRYVGAEFIHFQHGVAHSGDPQRAHIGMGATVASDAVLEPGAVVEMGATVGSGARICKGAIVRMGATVKPNAVIESHAVVSWGATVHQGAVVGTHAVVGTGSDIMEGAHVPPHTSLMPGATYRASTGPAPQPAQPPPKPQPQKPVDPRESRIDTICDRLETELGQSPESVRTFLGAGTDTIAALRRTCHDLLRRERALRDESSIEALERLASEKSVLESRIAKTTDDVVRRSLQGAVASIEEQQRQRALLQRNADRLDAEFTRLTYMLEGMAAQLVRLRSAAPQSGATTDPELEKSLVQLHSEIEAIAEALEHVSSGADDALPSPISEISSDTPEEDRARVARKPQHNR